MALPLHGAGARCLSDALGTGAGAPVELPSLQPVPVSPPVSAFVQLGGALTEVLVYAAAGAAGGFTLEVAAADDGEALWSAAAGSGAEGPVPLTAAIESSIAFLPGPDGSALRGYVGDAAGRLWRLELPPVPEGEAPADRWRLMLFAALDAAEDGEGAPSFVVAPELFQAVDGDGVAFDGVLAAGVVSAGEEARVDLFLLRDYAVGPHSGARPIATAELDDAGACPRARRDCPRRSGRGWLRRSAAPGDALAGSPLLDGGRVFLATWSRLSQDCETGVANRYVVILDITEGAPVPPLPEPLGLGRGAPVPPGFADGRVALPGLEEALTARGMDPAPILAARGRLARRLYWRDLRLDRD